MYFYMKLACPHFPVLVCSVGWTQCRGWVPFQWTQMWRWAPTVCLVPTAARCSVLEQVSAGLTQNGQKASNVGFGPQHPLLHCPDLPCHTALLTNKDQAADICSIGVMGFSLPLGYRQSQCFSVCWKCHPRCRQCSAESTAASYMLWWVGIWLLKAAVPNV